MKIDGPLTTWVTAQRSQFFTSGKSTTISKIKQEQDFTMRLFSHQILAHRNRLLLALVLSVTLAACGGESSEALIEKAQQSLASGDRKSAIIQLKSAIQKNENNAEARFWLGKLQLEMGDFASAEKEFMKARKAGYDADTVNPLLAKALIGQGELDRKSVV